MWIPEQRVALGWSWGVLAVSQSVEHPWRDGRAQVKGLHVRMAATQVHLSAGSAVSSCSSWVGEGM